MWQKRKLLQTESDGRTLRNLLQQEAKGKSRSSQLRHTNITAV